MSSYLYCSQHYLGHTMITTEAIKPQTTLDPSPGIGKLKTTLHFWVCAQRGVCDYK